MGKDDGKDEGKKKKKKVKMKLVANLQYTNYPIVSKAFKNRSGWKIAEQGEPYDLAWSDTNHVVRELRGMSARPSQLCPVQRVNHFPNNKQLVRKDYMAENLNMLQKVSPKLFDFSPRSWSLPRDNNALVRWVKEDLELRGGLSTRDPKDIPTYIVKPAAGLQGAGIKICQELHALENVIKKYDAENLELGETHENIHSSKKMVVQLYIDRPLTLDGFKFDIRLYVLVTSVTPLKVYVYDNGLCRLCTTRYSPPCKDNVKKMRAHLTNFAINKGSKNFVPGDQGTKRSFKHVLHQVQQMGYDSDVIWSRVIDVVVRSLIGICPLLVASYEELLPQDHILRTPTSTCFEVLGYDIMIDDDSKVWLLEMNHMPSFSGSSPLDSHVKSGVINGALDRVGVTLRRKHTLQSRLRKKRQGDILQQANNRNNLRLSVLNSTVEPFSRSHPATPPNLPLNQISRSLSIPLMMQTNGSNNPVSPGASTKAKKAKSQSRASMLAHSLTEQIALTKSKLHFSADQGSQPSSTRPRQSPTGPLSVASSSSSQASSFAPVPRSRSPASASGSSFKRPTVHQLPHIMTKPQSQGGNIVGAPRSQKGMWGSVSGKMQRDFSTRPPPGGGSGGAMSSGGAVQSGGGGGGGVSSGRRRASTSSHHQPNTPLLDLHGAPRPSAPPVQAGHRAGGGGAATPGFRGGSGRVRSRSSDPRSRLSGSATRGKFTREDNSRVMRKGSTASHFSDDGSLSDPSDFEDMRSDSEEMEIDGPDEDRGSEEEEDESSDSDEGGGMFKNNNALGEGDSCDGSGDDESTIGGHSNSYVFGNSYTKELDLQTLYNLEENLEIQQFRAPDINAQDQYVLVFNQSNEEDRARYAAVICAAKIAMSDKLQKHSGGDMTSRSMEGGREE